MDKTDFLKQYQSKEWYDTSKRIKARDHNTCQMCGRNDVPLSVHHRYYGENGSLLVPDNALITLCEKCHYIETTSKQSLYEILNQLIEECNNESLSMFFLNNFLQWIGTTLYYVRHGEIDKVDYAKKLLEQVLSETSSYSDFVAIKKMGYDCRDLVQKFYPGYIEQYNDVKVEK